MVHRTEKILTKYFLEYRTGLYIFFSHLHNLQISINVFQKRNICLTIGLFQQILVKIQV